MQQSRFIVNQEFLPPVSAEAQKNGQGFMAYPVCLWAGLTGEQIAWQQWIYQQAWANAQASLQRTREFKARAADMPRSWRN